MPRQEAYLSAALETSQGQSTIAITRDISTRGLLLLTRLPLQVGEVIKLIAVVGDAQHALTGKVIRVEPMEIHELWRYKAAITVDDTDPAFQQLYAALPERKRR